MYRLLGKNNEIKERRRHLRHPKYSKPELLATGPNQVWSWDITKLSVPVKWCYYHLYVTMDIFSRYIVGAGWWPIGNHRLWQRSWSERVFKSRQWRKSSWQRKFNEIKGSCLPLSDFGVTKTHSRPHTSNDNSYSESQFKTLKYCPEFPKRFGSIEDSRGFCRTFFEWYNKKHCHSGIALYPPEVVHYGRAGKAGEIETGSVGCRLSATSWALCEKTSCDNQIARSGMD